MVKQATPIPPRKCGVCNTEFQPNRPSQIICTQKCFRLMKSKQRNMEFASQDLTVNRICARCGDLFKIDDPLFITCKDCRIHHSVGGGCQRWDGVKSTKTAY